MRAVGISIAIFVVSVCSVGFGAEDVGIWYEVQEVGGGRWEYTYEVVNFSLVVGIEAVESAVEDARRNAVMNGVGNCHFILGDLRETLTRRQVRLSGWGSPSVMIIDPPRAGMHDDVLRSVIEIAPERIVYVSCNPTTQARDLAQLSGAYRIHDVQPVDMFPHTYHIENVVSLSR